VRDLPTRKTKQTASLSGSAKQDADGAAAAAKSGVAVALDLSVGSQIGEERKLAEAGVQLRDALLEYARAQTMQPMAVPLLVLILPPRPEVSQNLDLRTEHWNAQECISAPFSRAISADAGSGPKDPTSHCSL